MFLYQINLAKKIIAVCFIIINAFSIIFAIITISVSITAITSLHIIQDLDGQLYYLTNAIGLIAFCGVVWLISSWIGIFAACVTFFSFRDVCKQTAYGSHTVFLFLLTTLLAFEFIGTMVVFSIRNDLVENFDNIYLDLLQNGLSVDGNSQEYIYALENLQNYLTCCGYNGPEDYSKTQFGAYGRLLKSCCNLSPSSLTQCFQVGPGVIQYGCKAKIEDLFNKHYTDVGSIGLCFGFIELFAITLSALIIYLIYREDSGCFYTKC